MDPKKLLEEQLREAACLGDLRTLKDLILRGVDVNSKNNMNGWTPLHWAACRGNTEVVAILLRSGADKTSLTSNGKTPCDLTTSDEIQMLLDGKTSSKTSPQFPITPNYMRNPQFWYSNITKGRLYQLSSCKTEKMN